MNSLLILQIIFLIIHPDAFHTVNALCPFLNPHFQLNPHSNLFPFNIQMRQFNKKKHCTIRLLFSTGKLQKRKIARKVDIFYIRDWVKAKHDNNKRKKSKRSV
jgi:hypothetical protein